jgi:hypothetical protein
MFIKKVFLYFEPICADLASKFATLSANKTPKNYFWKKLTIYQKTQNFMLISKLLKKLQTNWRIKSYWQNCDGKMYFFHLYSCSSNWFPYNFLCVHFFATFLTVLKSAYNSAFFVILFDFFQKIFCKPLIENFEAKLAQNGSKNGQRPFLNRR